MEEVAEVVVANTQPITKQKIVKEKQPRKARAKSKLNDVIDADIAKDTEKDIQPSTPTITTVEKEKEKEKEKEQEPAPAIDKPKRGRKPNKIVTAAPTATATANATATTSTAPSETNEATAPASVSTTMGEQEHLESGGDSDGNVIKQTQTLKKRGRKPKGGKIVQPLFQVNENKVAKPNIILHLKCFVRDLETNSIAPNNPIESFNFPINKNDLSFDMLNESANKFVSNNTLANNEIITSDNDTLVSSVDENEFDSSDHNNNVNLTKREQKDAWKKIKILEHNLHTNNIGNKKSCCFWDSCEFDNHPVYIPKHFTNESYHVYGCFCSPECAVAYLMNESIDNSTKFERYHLLNHIYGKNCNYTHNIKPAPSPHYLLDRYYGNLNIQEYRSLLRKDRLFLIVDKPLTKILPELHEDNDDFILNNKIIPSNNYQIKKKMQKNNSNPTKNIINEQFGIA